MSEQAVNMERAVGLCPSWFGKLPSLGDFVGRRFPHPLRTAWDDWVGSGIQQLRHNAPEQWSQQFVHAPMWFFVAGSAIGGVATCGALAPSTDRVGRLYPISVLAMARREDRVLACEHDLKRFFSGVRNAIVEARRRAWSADELDTGLSNLPWPFASAEQEDVGIDTAADALLADLRHSGVNTDHEASVPTAARWRSLGEDVERSVWWSAHPAQNTVVVRHHGVLDSTLFSRLFHGQGDLTQ